MIIKDVDKKYSQINQNNMKYPPQGQEIIHLSTKSQNILALNVDTVSHITWRHADILSSSIFVFVNFWSFLMSTKLYHLLSIYGFSLIKKIEIKTKLRLLASTKGHNPYCRGNLKQHFHSKIWPLSKLSP